MKSIADYIYERQDGGTTYCYGKIEEDSNFDLVCGDELYDGVWAEMAEMNIPVPTWLQVCRHLEKYYRPDIEQIEAC